MIEAVLFDMDGLLVDTEPLWKLAEIKVFGSVGIDLTTTDCVETVGLRIDEVVDLWYNRHPWDNKTKSQVVQEIVEEMEHLIFSKAELLPGVEHAISLTASHNLKSCIASSSYQKLIDAVIQKFNLNQFAFGFSAEQLEFGKPHPQIFIEAAQKLGAQRTKCLVLEDSINGIIAAKAARMKVIAVPDQFTSKELALADVVLNSLADISPEHFR